MVFVKERGRAVIEGRAGGRTRARPISGPMMQMMATTTLATPTVADGDAGSPDEATTKDRGRIDACQSE
jgi:hypothetical protein